MPCKQFDDMVAGCKKQTGDPAGLGNDHVLTPFGALGLLNSRTRLRHCFRGNLNTLDYFCMDLLCARHQKQCFWG